MIQVGPQQFCESCEEGTGYVTAYGYNLPTVGYAKSYPKENISLEEWIEIARKERERKANTA